MVVKSAVADRSSDSAARSLGRDRFVSASTVTEPLILSLRQFIQPQEPVQAPGIAQGSQQGIETQQHGGVQQCMRLLQINAKQMRQADHHQPSHHQADQQPEQISAHQRAGVTA